MQVLRYQNYLHVIIALYVIISIIYALVIYSLLYVPVRQCYAINAML